MQKALILSLTGLALTLAAAPARAQDITIAVVGPMTGSGRDHRRTAETRRGSRRGCDQ